MGSAARVMASVKSTMPAICAPAGEAAPGTATPAASANLTAATSVGAAAAYPNKRRRVICAGAVPSVTVRLPPGSGGYRADVSA